MPRVKIVKKSQQERRCQKCSTTIEIGQPYRWWKFRYGGKRIRCLATNCAPRASDLTTSEFYQTLYGAQEQIEDVIQTADCPETLREVVEEAQGELENLKDEIEDKLMNVEEAFPNGSPVGELLEGRRDGLEELVNEMDSAASEISDLQDEWEKATEAQQKAEEKEEGHDWEIRSLVGRLGLQKDHAVCAKCGLTVEPDEMDDQDDYGCSTIEDEEDHREPEHVLSEAVDLVEAFTWDIE